MDPLKLITEATAPLLEAGVLGALVIGQFGVILYLVRMHSQERERWRAEWREDAREARSVIVASTESLRELVTTIRERLK